MGTWMQFLSSICKYCTFIYIYTSYSCTGTRYVYYSGMLLELMCYIPYNFICVTCTLFYRWIKFEEDVEEGGERWSKPHVATLSLHSLFELRCSLLTGTVMFDIEPYDLLSLVGRFSNISRWWRSKKILSQFLFSLWQFYRIAVFHVPVYSE